MVIRKMWDREIPIPEDLAVLGNGNELHFCMPGPVSLSSIQGNPNQAYAAAELLSEITEGKRKQKYPSDPQLPPLNVVTRQSTDVQEVEDLDLKKAMIFIDNHFTEDIGVADIARASGLSRRALENRFRERLNKSVHESIVRRRVQKAGELLVMTRLKHDVVAERVGFSSERVLLRWFKRFYDQTPGEFRGSRKNKEE